jgi:hypothetical protein
VTHREKEFFEKFRQLCLDYQVMIVITDHEEAGLEISVRECSPTDLRNTEMLSDVTICPDCNAIDFDYNFLPKKEFLQ